MAGQRGTGANAGLLARQAAQQGAANQQAAAGQGATLQAQQSMNAINAAGGMANQQAQQQANAITGYNQAAQGQQSNVLNALGAQNASQVAMQSNMNNANAGVSQSNAANSQSAAGGLLGGIAGAFGLAHGGAVPHYADGGPVSHIGQFIKGFGGVAPASPGAAPMPPANSFMGSPAAGGQAIGAALGKGISALGKAAIEPFVTAAHGGKVPALVSPGEAYLPPDKVEKVAKSKDKEETVKKVAEKIPGKAKVKGDSLKNDTVPKNLEEGGIVIPRSVMDSKDPSAEAAKFVSAILGRQGLKKK